jgi:hypothetical protein
MTCSAGKQSDADHTQCLPCDPGMFSSRNGSMCTPCAPGSYSASAGSPRCELCSPGMCSAGTATSPIVTSLTSRVCGCCRRCVLALVAVCVLVLACASPSILTGTYQEHSGETSCVPCMLGEFASASGLSVCSPCPHGYYCPDAKSAPNVCPAGYQCPANSELPQPCSSLMTSGEQASVRALSLAHRMDAGVRARALRPSERAGIALRSLPVSHCSPLVAASVSPPSLCLLCSHVIRRPRSTLWWWP